MRDYTGQTIYLGMDVHKASYSVTAICDGVIVKRDRLPANPSELLKYCKRFFPNGVIRSAYEASFCGFGLHRLLVEHQIQNIVVHPASVAIKKNDRVKTDKRDSLKIALQLSQGSLTGIHIPSCEQEAARSLSRLRATLIKDRSRYTNRVKGLLYFHGVRLSLKRLSEKKCKQLHELNLPADIQFTLDLWLNEWKKASINIRMCEQRLTEQGTNDELEPYYRSVPGIGKVTSRVLSNELGDMTQFTNEKHLFSYCGLTPSEYSSGETVRRGRITKQDKSFLRMYLTEAAWRAIRKDPALEEAFKRIMNQTGSKKKAAQAIARKLIGRARTCVLKREAYEVGKT